MRRRDQPAAETAQSANCVVGLLRLRRSTAAAIAIAIATVPGIATTSATAATFARTFVEFFSATTARTFVLALRTVTATTGLLHAAGAAAVLALMDGARLRFRRAGTVARGECNFEFVEFVPLGIGTVAIRDRQQFQHARARRR